MVVVPRGERWVGPSADEAFVAMGLSSFKFSQFAAIISKVSAVCFI